MSSAAPGFNWITAPGTSPSRRSAMPTTPAADTAGTATLAATVRSVRATPDEVRLVVDADGIGELDAVAAPHPLPEPDDRVHLRVDVTRIALL